MIGWKGKLLSSVGKLQLLMSSLQGITVYFLYLFKIYHAMAERLEEIQKTSFGRRREERLSLVSWDIVCKPKSKGGLGIRNIIDLNNALLTKIGWKLAKDEAS